VAGNRSEDLQHQVSWKGTSGPIKNVTTEFSDIGEALKTVIATTGDHCGAVSVPIRHAHPCKSTDRGLVNAVVSDG
jgi:hypothetical protein